MNPTTTIWTQLKLQFCKEYQIQSRRCKWVVWTNV